MSLGLPPTVFFGYPSRPALRRTTIQEAAVALSRSGEVVAQTWEDLSVTGKLIIHEVMSAIDRATVAVFDITDLNENVLFELGYAIGSNRQIWLIREGSVEASLRRWEKFGLLRTIGHSTYDNTEDIASSFLQGQPHHRDETILQQLVEPSSRSAPSRSVLYLASPHDTNAERAVRRTLERERSHSFDLAVADPTESATEPLAWYAQSIAEARGVVSHLTSRKRQEAEVHNARLAFLSGLAVGLGKQVLILAEEDYTSPIDYQDMLHVYSIPKDATARLTNWLHDYRSKFHAPVLERVSAGMKSALTLRTLRLGAHVAEDESVALADYFVETGPYIDVLGGGTRLFVGRKGTGKTAVLLNAFDELASDVRNVVCAIRPPGYELESLLRLVRRYRDKDTKGYLIESMWKFLIYSELAKTTADQIRRQRAVIVPGSPEAELIDVVDSAGDLLSGDFAVRLERIVDDLLPLDVGTGVAVGRVAISEALHDTLLRRLRILLSRALAGRSRVAVLIDNLDKAWERDADLPDLTQFLLGLLAAVRPIAADFQKRDGARQPVALSVAVFLRSDIYWHLTRNAREPDKLTVSRLDWSDRQLLIRVLEERYAAVQGVVGSSIWSQLFCAEVDGKPTPDWLLDSILSRPRDLIYLANSAITNAVNRGHEVVDPSDLRDARYSYSSYAIESVLVEGEPDIPSLEDILFEFAGCKPVLGAEDVLRRISAGRSRRKSALSDEDVLLHLLVLSFIGIETDSDSVPAYVDNPQELARANAIALARVGDSGLAYRIHPAFRPYLEIS